MFDDGLNDYMHDANRRDTLGKLAELLREYAVNDGTPRQGFAVPILAMRVTPAGALEAYRRWPGILPRWRDQRLDKLRDRQAAILITALRKELGYVPRHGG